MHIYIDESGTFQPTPGTKNSVSCLCAVIVPDAQHVELMSRYEELRISWGAIGEVKGSALNEGQTNSLIELLLQYDVVLEACAIELGNHSADGVATFKHLQADAIVAGVQRDFSAGLAQELHNLSTEYRSMSNQLFVQSVAYTRLVELTLRDATLYFCQRRPVELGSFAWIVDSKNDNRYEQIWSLAVMPALEWRFLQEPLIFLEGCDYTAFATFDYASTTIEAPVGNLNRLWKEHLVFGDSRADLGLELADILANCLRRALRGNLQIAGWVNLGRLMIARRPHAVTWLRLAGVPTLVRNPERYVIANDHFDATARQMLLPARD